MKPVETATAVAALVVVAAWLFQRRKKKKKAWAMPEGASTTLKTEASVASPKVPASPTGKPDTLGTTKLGMVSSSQKMASAAGVSILQKGGTAVDAAVAMAAVLCVTEPGSTDLGADCFMLIYDPAIGKVVGVNGSGRSSRHASREQALRDMNLPEGSQVMAPIYRNGQCVTVPGCVAAWCDAHARYGALTLKEVLAPAEKIARDGFVMADRARRAVDEYEVTGQDRAFFEEMGIPLSPDSGELTVRTEMADVLKEIQHGGKSAFYGGATALAVEKAVKAKGGVLDAQDFANHKECLFTTPISTTFQGVTVWEHGPNGAGLVVLVALNILEALGEATAGGVPQLVGDWTDGAAAAKSLHTLIEVMRWSFNEARKVLADAGSVPETAIDALLDKNLARELAKKIDLTKATAYDKITEELKSRKISPVNFGTGDTVAFNVIDGEGRSVSMVNSTYKSFGSVIAARGFCLQNRGHNFTLEQGHPNVLEPNKRPYHTILPCLLTRLNDGSLFASFTNMGGFMQPTGHVLQITNLLVRKLGAQEAVDAPRFCINSDDETLGIAFGSMLQQVHIEPTYAPSTLEALAAYGHTLNVLDPDPYLRGKLVGKAQIILSDGKDMMRAGSDYRADGCPLAVI